MSNITFSQKEKELLVQKIQGYAEKELDREMSRFEAEFMLEFITKEIGSYFYNRGLYDAQTMLNKKLDDLTESILSLEKPTDAR